tara:strand:+ start:3248 stop:3364 length:117 start_codon:yes stop_codon:yes gene_type:complete
MFQGDDVSITVVLHSNKSGNLLLKRDNLDKTKMLEKSI